MAAAPGAAQAPSGPAAETGGPCEEARGPLSLVNENPLRQPFLRPAPRSACPSRAARFELRVGAANHFLDARDGARWAFFDAETYRLDLAVALPLGRGRELRLEMPFLARSQGVLDAPIEGWHALFGLPDGTRPDYPRNRIRLLVGSDELHPELRLLLARFDPASGPGDLTVSVQQRLPLGDARSAAALHAAVELPTGSLGELAGNGSPDLALGAAVSSRVAEGLWTHWNAEVVLLASSPLESPGLRQSSRYGRLLAALEWRAAPGWHLLAQGLAESTPLKVGVELLDRESLLLALGVRRAWGAGFELEASLGEDLRVQTAPDLSVQAGVRWTP